MDEIFIHILTGVFLIVVGLLVKRFPMLIAGYNTMPADLPVYVVWMLVRAQRYDHNKQ